MATIHLPQDFKEFLKLLNRNKVEYLLVGGYAVGYYGYPRATADMDIWVAINQKNAGRIISVLKEFGFDSPDLSEDTFLKEKQVIRMGQPPVRIELLTTLSGVGFDECFKEKTQVAIGDVKVNIISLKHLKINKAAAGRYSDKADLEKLP
jgi:predicted nucleotidyltransferase